MFSRCPCCDAHAVRENACLLCFWSKDESRGYDLAEARENVRKYGVMYRPADNAFATVRHPILGPAGEYAVDRVALRERAYLELRAFGAGRPERVELTARLDSLLACIENADRLYTRRFPH